MALSGIQEWYQVFKRLWSFFGREMADTVQNGVRLFPASWYVINQVFFDLSRYRILVTEDR